MSIGLAYPGGMSKDAVTAATRAHQIATRQAGRTRERLHAAILAALDAGMTQAELSRLTGYTRERLRQIARGVSQGQ